MSKVTIGILGATGLIGMKTLEHLIKGKAYGKAYKVVAGARQPHKLSEKFTDETNCEFRRVDIMDDELLGQFCKESDIVINAAGPASRLLDRVARVCLEQKAHYIDPSGDYDVVRKVETMRKNRSNKDQIFLMAVGSYPGLTELYPAYLVESQFEKAQSVSAYFSGVGKLSQNAADDIIQSMKKKEGDAMVYWDTDRLKPLDGNSLGRIPSSKSVDKLVKFPVVSPHFQSFCKAYDLKKGYFQNTFLNHKQFSKFIAVATSTASSKSGSCEKLIRDLVEAYAVDASEEYTSFAVVASGIDKAGVKTASAELRYEGNWNELTAVLLSIAGQFIARGQVKSRSGIYMEDVLYPVELVETLKENSQVREYINFI